MKKVKFTVTIDALYETDSYQELATHVEDSIQKHMQNLVGVVIPREIDKIVDVAVDVKSEELS